MGLWQKASLNDWPVPQGVAWAYNLRACLKNARNRPRGEIERHSGGPKGTSLRSGPGCERVLHYALMILLTLVLGACAPATPGPSTPGVTIAPTATVGAEVRAPAVAGRFYPGDPRSLGQMVDALLDDVAQAGDLPRLPTPPMALIVPHAGYIFSGKVAAYAFHQVRGTGYDVVVVVGTNHTDPAFHKVSVYAKGSFQTPLGQVPIDEDLATRLLAANPQLLVFDRNVHRYEHSIEVELPFLQRVLPGVKIVPIVVGDPSLDNAKALSDALVQALAGRHALIVASSDLSHYPRYEDAYRVDKVTLQAILSLEPMLFQKALRDQEGGGVPGLATCACGEGPILVAMMAAKGLGANQTAVLKYANSGDTPFGGRDQVVGYAAVAFWRGSPLPPSPTHTVSAANPAPLGALVEADKARLLTIARQAIIGYLRYGFAPTVALPSPALERPAAVFVTLKKRGELRGCIGQVLAEYPLYLAVQRAAIQAAVDDPRFPPVQMAELPEIKIEVSVLSPLEPVQDVREIQVGKHGLFIVQGKRSGLLLPQVAVEEGWDRQAFLEGVCHKAGLPADAWQKGASLFKFTAEVLEEP